MTNKRVIIIFIMSLKLWESFYGVVPHAVLDNNSDYTKWILTANNTILWDNK